MTDFLLSLAERVIGRKRLWKLSRRAYLYARGSGSLDMERNGELLLQRQLAGWSAANKSSLTVIDVGANYGQWSTSFLRELERAHAPAPQFTLFEPVPQIREALNRNLQPHRDRGADIIVHPFAVSDEPGQARFFVTDVSAGDHHLESADMNFAGEAIEVEVVTVDAMAGRLGLGHVHMIKIDAEGYDPKVMAGMSDLLASGQVDLVQFEYSILFLRSRAFLYDIFKLAEQYGYGVATLSHHGVQVHGEWNADLERFYGMSMLLVHPRAHGMIAVTRVSYDNANVYA